LAETKLKEKILNKDHSRTQTSHIHGAASWRFYRIGWKTFVCLTCKLCLSVRRFVHLPFYCYWL